MFYLLVVFACCVLDNMEEEKADQLYKLFQRTDASARLKQASLTLKKFVAAFLCLLHHHVSGTCLCCVAQSMHGAAHVAMHASSSGSV